MISVLFFIRAEKLLKKKKTAPVYLRITVEGKRVEIATGLYTKVDTWNKGSLKSYVLKNKIKILENKVTELIRKLILNGASLSPYNIKMFYLRDIKNV